LQTKHSMFKFVGALLRPVAHVNSSTANRVLQWQRQTRLLWWALL